MRRLFACLVSLAMLIAAGSARADVIERVVAVVNDDAIFLSELRRRSASDLAQVMSASTRTEREQLMVQLYTRRLDELIDERLIGQAARRAQISVSADDVDRAIDNVKRQSRLDSAQFWEAVRAQGYTEPQYREDVRRQLLRLKLLNQRVRGRVNITDEDVRQFYDGEVRRARSQTTFVAADILIPLRDGATATEVVRARRQAEALRAEITPDNYDDEMREHGGFELGELRQGQLDSALEDALLGMDVGAVSAPVLNAAGFHILLLRSRGQGADQIPEFAQVRDAIHRHMLEEAMRRQESQYIEELRREANIRKLL